MDGYKKTENNKVYDLDQKKKEYLIRDKQENILETDKSISSSNNQNEEHFDSNLVKKINCDNENFLNKNEFNDTYHNINYNNNMKENDYNSTDNDINNSKMMEDYEANMQNNNYLNDQNVHDENNYQSNQMEDNNSNYNDNNKINMNKKLEVIKEEKEYNLNKNVNNFDSTTDINNIQNFNSQYYQINNNYNNELNKEEDTQQIEPNNFEVNEKLMKFTQGINYSYCQNDDYNNKWKEKNDQNLIKNLNSNNHGETKYYNHLMKNSNSLIIDNNNNKFAESQMVINNKNFNFNNKNSIYDYKIGSKFNNEKTADDKDENELEDKSCFYSQDSSSDNDIDNINDNNIVNKKKCDSEKDRTETYSKFKLFVEQIKKDMSGKEDDKMKKYTYPQDDVLEKELEKINNAEFLKDKDKYEYLKHILKELTLTFCRSQFKNQNFKVSTKQDDYISSDPEEVEDKFHTIECFNDYNTSKTDGDDNNKERQGIQIVIETDKKNNDVKSIFFRIGVFVPEENNDKKKDDNNISNNVNSSKNEKFLLTKGSEFQMHVLSKKLIFKNGSFVPSKQDQNYNVEEKTVLLTGGGIIANKSCTKYTDKDKDKNINEKYELQNSLKEAAGSTDEIVYKRLKVYDGNIVVDLKKDNYELLGEEKPDFQFTYFDDNSKVEQPQEDTEGKGGCFSCLSQCCGGNKRKEPNEVKLYEGDNSKQNNSDNVLSYYNKISESKSLVKEQIVEDKIDKSSGNNSVNVVKDKNEYITFQRKNSELIEEKEKEIVNQNNNNIKDNNIIINSVNEKGDKNELFMTNIKDNDKNKQAINDNQNIDLMNISIQEPISLIKPLTSKHKEEKNSNENNNSKSDLNNNNIHDLSEESNNNNDNKININEENNNNINNSVNNYYNKNIFPDMSGYLNGDNNNLHNNFEEKENSNLVVDNKVDNKPINNFSQTQSMTKISEKNLYNYNNREEDINKQNLQCYSFDNNLCNNNNNYINNNNNNYINRYSYYSEKTIKTKMYVSDLLDNCPKPSRKQKKID